MSNQVPETAAFFWPAAAWGASEEHVKAAWVQQVYSPATLQTHLSGIKLICWVI